MNILICNVGSTSLKYQLFRMPEELVLASGGAERVGAGEGRFYAKTHENGALTDESAVFPTHRRGHCAYAAAADRHGSSRSVRAGLRGLQGRVGKGHKRRAGSDGRCAFQHGGVQLHRTRAQSAVSRRHPAVPCAAARYAAHRRVRNGVPPHHAAGGVLLFHSDRDFP